MQEITSSYYTTKPNDSIINVNDKFKSQKNKSPNLSIANFIPRIIFLFSLAFISLYVILLSVRSIPNLSLPTSIEGVKHQAIILENYSNETWRGYLHIIVVFSLIYVWKQAFSIPGAIFLNILAGALYGPLVATLMTSLLTAIGASCAYLLSRFVGQSIIDQYLSDKLNYLRKQVDDNRNGLFFYLLFIRMFPLSPWWLLNLASPLLYIPLGIFFTSMFFGSISYNLACCQAGDLLSELSSTNDIWQPLLLFKMILVSLLSLLPPLYTKRYKKLQNNDNSSEQSLMVKTEQDIV